MHNAIKKLTSVFSILALVVVTTGSALAAHNPVSRYQANLNTLNNSGVNGRAQLFLKGDQLTVQIHARGFEKNKIHPQHIHGFDDSSQNAVCPTSAQDTNNDGIVDLEEGAVTYGPVQLSLEPFQTAPNGRVDFVQTFTINKDDLGPLENRHIVLHGMTVNNEYVPTLPVACGQIFTTAVGDNSDNNNGDNNDPNNNTRADIVIRGNGANSRNSVDFRLNRSVRLFQGNDTSISNNIDLESRTGNNRSNSNTGGGAFIRTGDSFQSVQIRNFAGFNSIQTR